MRALVLTRSRDRETVAKQQPKRVRTILAVGEEVGCDNLAEFYAYDTRISADEAIDALIAAADDRARKRRRGASIPPTPLEVIDIDEAGQQVGESYWYTPSDDSAALGVELETELIPDRDA
jgi:hypothetical protein